MAIHLFMLEKMRIEVFAAVARKGRPETIELMFNPASLQEAYAVGYQPESRRAINSAATPAKYTVTPPAKLALTFILDGTGVNYTFKLQQLMAGASVRQQVENFKRLCWRTNGDTHQPRFLVIRWGRYSFSCRLESLGISYTLFDKSGDPLRAELAVSFVADASLEKIVRQTGLNSPDLTHIRTVRSGDTLPLLCKQIYGSSAHYLRVARENGLDDFRDLQPGQRLSFSPLPGAAAAGSGA